MSTVSKRPRSTLFWVIVISAGAHLLVGALVASWKIYRYTSPPEATFSSPPPAARVPPANLEYRVAMQQLQQQSQRPPSQTAGQVDSLLNQSLDSLDSPSGGAFGTSALAGTPVVVSAGTGRLGRLSGGGGGMNFGASAVDFFGIKKQGERVVFIVDAGASMVEPERGDLPGYERVKAELVKMVEGLSPGTFFNIIVFERDVDLYAPRMVVATADNTSQVAAWIAPYWRLSNGKIVERGTYRKNYAPQLIDWNGAGGSSRMDLALAAALELRADLIFMITDGTPSIRQGRKASEDERWRRRVDKYDEERARYEASDKGQREMVAYEKERAAWQAARDKVRAERAAQGLPPIVREGGSRGAPSRPGPSRPSRPTSYYDLDELQRWVRRRASALYESNGGAPPSLSVVGYSPNARGTAVIEALAKTFPDGTSRVMGAFDASQTN
ncbi:hypothetical protein [Synoicihabitans lomoniglobus]|uniref:VWFA domain-containing protein n=1 Tax=Synoicihabitans lomoniglobus TaxID=2909285 RepID=A0AAE9ZV50_9BACT|nr:hypothetical protein [Opitutaceae bacterium LMO-M01]WED64741.1 hypothetical protein PXH66_20550 [Opitutaceae bacterium LMO-M01]